MGNAYIWVLVEIVSERSVTKSKTNTKKFANA